MRKAAAGFTLVELLVVVVIVGILATIAVPSYQGYVARSNRSAVKSVLQEIASRQESFLADRKQYAASLTALGYPADDLFLQPGGQLSGTSATETLYSISLDAPGDGTYSLVAAPLNVQAVRDAECASLTLTSAGTRSASGDATSCWG